MARTEVRKETTLSKFGARCYVTVGIIQMEGF